jgi:hypothetical protein
MPQMNFTLGPEDYERIEDLAIPYPGSRRDFLIHIAGIYGGDLRSIIQVIRRKKFITPVDAAYLRVLRQLINLLLGDV